MNVFRCLLFSIYMISTCTVAPNPYNDGCRATSRCYRSYRKSEIPHTLEVSISATKAVSHGCCTCANGQSGHCGHVVGLLYQLAHFKITGTNYIPEDAAKTSLPQTWHIPRGEKIKGEAVDQIRIHSFKSDKKSDGSICCTYMYNPLSSEPPCALSLVESLKAATTTMLPFSISKKKTPLVDTKYGKYPRGSTLAHQQKLHDSFIMNITEPETFPDLPLRNVMSGEIPHLPEEKKDLFVSLKITQKESIEIEKDTRLQSNCPLWHKLRQHRITASVVADVAKRKKDFQALSKRLKSSKTRMTQAMKDGIANEPLAAEAYSNMKGNTVNLYPAGIIIHPDAFWLAASPDRKVYDQSRTQDPFGLLEIKCPSMSTRRSLEELPYLEDINAEELGMVLECPRLFHDGENIIICKINKTAIKEANCKAKLNVVMFEWIDNGTEVAGCHSVYNTTEKCTTGHGHGPGSCWCAESSEEILTYKYSYQANSTHDKGKQIKCSLCVVPQKHLKISISAGCNNFTFDDHEDSGTDNKSNPANSDVGTILGVVLGVVLGVATILVIMVICIKKHQSFLHFCKTEGDARKTFEDRHENNELMSLTSTEGKQSGRAEQNGH